jgi:hypothetical protein
MGPSPSSTRLYRHDLIHCGYRDDALRNGLRTVHTIYLPSSNRPPGRRLRFPNLLCLVGNVRTPEAAIGLNPSLHPQQRPHSNSTIHRRIRCNDVLLRDKHPLANYVRFLFHKCRDPFPHHPPPRHCPRVRHLHRRYDPVLWRHALRPLEMANDHPYYIHDLLRRSPGLRQNPAKKASASPSPSPSYRPQATATHNTSLLHTSNSVPIKSSSVSPVASPVSPATLVEPSPSRCTSRSCSTRRRRRSQAVSPQRQKRRVHHPV